MGKIATPHEVVTAVDKDQLVLHIVGGGTLRMPRDAAHQLAQDIMANVAVIDKRFPRGQSKWPRLFTK